MELIQQITQQLGVSDQQAKGGVGLILDMVKSKVGGDEFSQVSSAIPEAGELISAAPKKVGVTNALSGMVSNITGKNSGLGNLADLAGGFSSLDLDSDMIGKFLPVILSFVQSKGGDTVKNIIAGVLK